MRYILDAPYIRGFCSEIQGTHSNMANRGVFSDSDTILNTILIDFGRFLNGDIYNLLHLSLQEFVPVCASKNADQNITLLNDEVSAL
jgi:hypothetical protein